MALFRASTNPDESQSKQMRLSNVCNHLHNIAHPLTLPEPRQDIRQLDHARCLHASLSAGMHACLGFCSQLLMHFSNTSGKKKKRKESDFSSWHCIGLMRVQKGQSVVRHNGKLAQQIMSRGQDCPLSHTSSYPSNPETRQRSHLSHHVRQMLPRSWMMRNSKRER
jgi:hypothetical protein